IRAVDPDDAAAGPLAQLRVGARLEPECAEDGRRRTELCHHVVAGQRGLPPVRADRNASAKDDAPCGAQLERPVADVDHDLLANRLHVDARRRHPARAAVRTAGKADPVPLRLPLRIALDSEREHDARPEVVTELAEYG